MANQLMGVTMHEAGVSRIVAVDINEAAEFVASWSSYFSLSVDLVLKNLW